jgi:hypothetical protein
VTLIDDFFKIVAAGPAFFVSAWLLMIFAGIAGAEALADMRATVRACPKLALRLATGR